jgi:hypothetical protein
MLCGRIAQVLCFFSVFLFFQPFFVGGPARGGATFRSAGACSPPRAYARANSRMRRSPPTSLRHELTSLHARELTTALPSSRAPCARPRHELTGPLGPRRELASPPPSSRAPAACARRRHRVPPEDTYILVWQYEEDSIFLIKINYNRIMRRGLIIRGLSHRFFFSPLFLTDRAVPGLLLPL